MRTRLTELLGIDHPVMFAGMEACPTRHSPPQCPTRAASAASAPRRWATSLGWSAEIAARPPGHRHALRGRSAHRDARRPERPGQADDRGRRGERVRSGARRAHQGRRPLPQPRPADGVRCAGRSTTRGAPSTRAATSSWRRGPRREGTPGQVAPFPLVPMIVDAVGDAVPVVAAGGVFDGRGLAASLALGADGVWVGHVHRDTRGAGGSPGSKSESLGQPGGPARRSAGPIRARRCAW